MLAPLLTFGQIKGENSKEPFTSIKGTEYKKGTKITLKSPSNKDKFAYVYKFKSSLSFGNIVKTVKNVNDVKNMKRFAIKVNIITNESNTVVNDDKLLLILSNAKIAWNINAR